MQRTLYEDDLEEDNTLGKNISEFVRDSTFESIKPELAERQLEILKIILLYPAGGISSRGISKHLDNRPLNTFSGRLTELANPKGYDKPPYHNPPLIEPCGVEQYPDFEGRMRSYTKYRVRRSFTL